MNPETGEVTNLLTRWQRGDQAALEHLAPLIRQELMRLARRKLAREGNGKSVQPSSLVQEVFLRLMPAPDVDWRSRAHFFAVASEDAPRSGGSCAPENARQARRSRNPYPGRWRGDA